MAQGGVKKAPPGVKILSIDAKDIYISNHYIHPSEVGYNIRNKDGDIILKKFSNVLDYSLDSIKLREVYEKVYRRRDFSFFTGNKEYTTRIINVTFKYSVKEYNEVRKNIYVKNGYRFDEINLIDNVDVRNGELIAICCESAVEAPISGCILGR